MERLALTGVALCFLSAALLSAASPTLKREADRKKAPEFELQDKDGNTVRLADYRDKVVVIDFWATWCGPCKAEMPWLIELSKKYQEEGLVVLGISMDSDGWTTVKPFIEKMGVSYPILKGTKRVAYLYGDVDALPVAFFVDRQQKVAAIHLGALSRKQFEQTVRSLLEAK